MTRVLSFALLLCFAAYSPGAAFQTWPCQICPGALASSPVHDEITEILMREAGFTQYGFERLVNWMEQSDEPGSTEVHTAANHFDDNTVEHSRNVLLARLDLLLDESVSGSVLMPEMKMWDSGADHFYRVAGLIFHALQDFYAHTTFLENSLSLVEKGKIANAGDIDTLPLMDFSLGKVKRTANAPKMTPEESELLLTEADRQQAIENYIIPPWKAPMKNVVKSGYYSGYEIVAGSTQTFLTDEKSKHPEVDFKTLEEYGAFLDREGKMEPMRPELIGAWDRLSVSAPGIAMEIQNNTAANKPQNYLSFERAIDNALSIKGELHFYLQKDGPWSPMGRVTETQRFHMTMHEMAKRLAARATLEMWNEIESRIKKEYPVHADCILQTIKTGILSQDCMEYEPVDRGNDASYAWPLKVAFTTDMEGKLHLNMDEAQMTSAHFDGGKRIVGGGRLKVDWATGEVAGWGYAELNDSRTFDAKDYLEQIHAEAVKPKNSITVYFSGWMADGAKQVKILRVYSLEKEHFKVEGDMINGEVPPPQDPKDLDRVVDLAFGDLPIDGTVVKSKPIEMSYGDNGRLGHYSEQEMASVKLRGNFPAGLVAKDYKKTRKKFGDPGPLGASLHIPPPDNWAKMLQEAKSSLKELKGEIPGMMKEMEEAMNDPDVPKEMKELLRSQKKAIDQAPEAIEKLENMDTSDKDNS